VDAVWQALHDPAKTVVAQVAPAVRVALGEIFGLPPGTVSSSQLVTALRRLGVAKVYDTAFSADLTVVEEAHEFLQRKASGQRLPQFTSCCPAWVKFAEQYFPDLLPNLSSCKSPSKCWGPLQSILPAELAFRGAIWLSSRSCPARRKNSKPNGPNCPRRPARRGHVLTTQELGRMIEEAGLRFADLEPGSFDLPWDSKPVRE
jgi:NADH-quinone oxidoreductase subunit G